MKQGLRTYALVTLGVVLVVGALLSIAFRDPADIAAIGLSGAITLVVQLTAYGISRLPGLDNVMARMGTGAILRLVTLVVYAIVVAKFLTLPLVAALISLAAFFFLSTLIEPLLSKSKS